MNNFNTRYNCQNCFDTIEDRVFQYSFNSFGISLCRPCQDWFREILDFTSATNEAIDLYFELKRRGVPAELEKYDGYKRVDISVPDAHVHIEVDGGHHSFDFDQGMRDLERTIHSFKRGYSTLRIPNGLVENDLERTADLITEYLVVGRNKKSYRF